MITPNWNPASRQLRQFAVVCLPAFAALGYLMWGWTGRMDLGIALPAFGAVCAIAGLWRPGSVRPLYLILSAVTLPIGLLLSALLLRIIFYGVFTPMGLLSRLIRDPLRLRKPDVDSYWQQHQKRRDRRAYFRQA